MEQVQSLFETAVALPPAERNAFVSGAEAIEPVVRDEVAALLNFDSQVSEDDDARLADATRSIIADLAEQATSLKHVGRYELLERVAIGGMGIVYRARQTSPEREVALKLVRLGRVRPSTIRRFRIEAESLARLRHPGIARIYDAGAAATEWGDIPFIAMEFLHGRPLLEYVRDRKLDTRARVELIASICDAVEHAHQHGVMHRDLKPANILVECVDGRAQPKVLDFGVARLVTPRESQPTLATEVGHIVGTLAYMSPEQVSGEVTPDTRTDVYALGAVAYEVLTGRLPLGVEELTVCSAIRVIREEIPRPIGSIDPALAGDISTIVAKALAKEREQRYGSAAALAEDLRRHLRNEPILARPPSTLYLLRKFAARNRVGVGAGAAILIALAAGATALVYGLVAARTANAALEAQLDAEQDSAAFLVRDIAENLNSVVGTARVRRKLLEQLESQLASLVARTPDDPEVIDSYASVLEFLGDLDHMERRGAAAESLRRRCIALRGQLVAEHPDVESYKARLSVALVKLGDVFNANNDPNEAFKWHTQAFEIDQRLVRQTPESRWFLDNLAWSYDRIGNYWIQHGNPELAEQLFEQSIAINERLLELEPNNLTTLHGIAAVNGLLADAAEKRRDGATLQTRRDAALAAARQLVAAQPQNRVYLLEAHFASRAVAELFEARGEFARAASLRDEALQLSERIVALDPTDSRSRQWHFEALLKRAELALALGDADTAEQFTSRAASIADTPATDSTGDWPAERFRGLVEAQRRAIRAVRAGFEPAPPLNP